jgi:hypothetical protein
LSEKLSPEQIYRAKIDPYFKIHFEMETEVYSKEGKRIDYILKCKQFGVIFGVEVKHTGHMRGVDIGKYLKQASGYSEMFWKTRFASNPIKVPIFITPAISNTIKQIVPESKKMLKPHWVDGKPNYDCDAEYYQAFHEQNDKHSNVHSMISEAFNIGEIKTVDNNFVFMFANKPIWKSNYNKLHITNYNFYWGGNVDYISFLEKP